MLIVFEELKANIGLPKNTAITRVDSNGAINVRLYAKGDDWTLADGMEQLVESIATTQETSGVNLDAELIRAHQRPDGSASGGLIHITSIQTRRPS